MDLHTTPIKIERDNYKIITSTAPYANTIMRKDPAFYVWDADAHVLVATITNVQENRTIYVYCDGIMRLNLWESEEARHMGLDPAVIRYTDDLMSYGVDTDKKLEEADSRIEWINNTWFDLYTDDGWFDCVCHDVDDAIDLAMAYTIDDDLWNARNEDGF